MRLGRCSFQRGGEHAAVCAGCQADAVFALGGAGDGTWRIGGDAEGHSRAQAQALLAFEDRIDWASVAHLRFIMSRIRRGGAGCGTDLPISEQTGGKVLGTDITGHRSLSRAATRITGAPGDTGNRLGTTALTALETMPRWPANCSPCGSASRWSPVGPMREGRPWRARMNGARGRERLRADQFALGEGWRVVRTSGGHLKFTKTRLRVDSQLPDCERPPCRPQCSAQLRRADRQAGAGERPWLS